MNRLLRVNYSLYFGTIFVAVLLFFCFFGPMIAPHSLTTTLETQYIGGKVLAPPLEPFESERYPFGTDKWGYDLMSLILNGIRYTVFVAAAVTVIKMLFGTVLGLYIGTLKKAPGWMIAFENAWSYVPLFLILYFFLRPISFNSQLETSTLVAYFIIIASIISIPSIVSSVRLKTEELNRSVYIEAAQALGAGRNRIVWKHIFPQLKESFLVMFILEIVYVITIMGQLALMNIFVGGTIVRFDPLIYLSLTNELAGLVGQARGNIYGNTHILAVPLIILLFTTVSFSLLANGLKNHFQSAYQRTAWIRTGQEPRIITARKQFGEKAKFWPPSGHSLAFSVIVLVFIGAGTYVYVTKDSDVGVKNEAKSEYDLRVEMKNDGEFKAKANISIKNKSDDDWNELVFYLIPNEFKEGHRFSSVKGSSKIEITGITINGEKAKYTLEKDTLKIELSDKMKGKKKHKAEVSYEFTVPEEGNRFSKINDNYYLAQWYPMAATYQNGKWNKEEYVDSFESFHTGFSDFEVSYKIPKGYSFVSTAEKDPDVSVNEGKVRAKRVRDFFIAIMKDMDVHETKAEDGVKIRLFTKDDHDKDPDKSLELAQKALSFYQKEIGDYPHKQLDIILDLGPFMEYPGIVTINPYKEDLRFYNNSIIHEVAHQYFYGVVANDPYHQAWVDEGITEFAVSMYYFAGENQAEEQAFGLPRYRMTSIAEKGLGRQYSNVPLDQIKHSGYIYGQPAIEIFEMLKSKYKLKGDDLKEVSMGYLSDYYKEFKYKEVDTQQFIRFTKDYFGVPTGYFNNWLDTTKTSS